MFLLRLEILPLWVPLAGVNHRLQSDRRSKSSQILYITLHFQVRFELKHIFDHSGCRRQDNLRDEHIDLILKGLVLEARIVVRIQINCHIHVHRLHQIEILHPLLLPHLTTTTALLKGTKNTNHITTLRL